MSTPVTREPAKPIVNEPTSLKSGGDCPTARLCAAVVASSLAFALILRASRVHADEPAVVRIAVARSEGADSCPCSGTFVGTWITIRTAHSLRFEASRGNFRAEPAPKSASS